MHFKIQRLMTKHVGSTGNANFFMNENVAYFISEGINHEYILADPGYTLYPYILTPYRKPQVAGSLDNFDFNLIHSSG